MECIQRVKHLFFLNSGHLSDRMLVMNTKQRIVIYEL